MKESLKLAAGTLAVLGLLAIALRYAPTEAERECYANGGSYIDLSSTGARECVKP
jgi:hypothetical protein